MPESHFFTAPESLSQQVADFLLGGVDAGRLDLAHTLLITPTAGATRQVNRRLKAAGHKAPASAQPMQALLPGRDDIASPVERCLAWSAALENAGESVRQALFWKKTPQTTAELLKAARNFNKLGDLLAEGGYALDTLRLPAPLEGGFEQERWAAIASLYRDYLGQLETWKLQDPNALRLQQIQLPETSFHHLVIACVPDLPKAFETFVNQLESRSIPVDLLVWNPTKADERDFDRWGRPVEKTWNERAIAIQDQQIHVAASARDEARRSARQTIAGTASLVVADPKQQALLASELRALGRQPYLPEGKPLIRCEAAKIALEWTEFVQSKDLRRLRRLLELPAFCRALDPENPITPADALRAMDHLLGETIAGHLDAAWAASPALPEHAPPRDQKIRAGVRRLLGTVRALLAHPALEVLERAYPGEDERPESAKRVLQIGRELESSPAVRQTSKEKRQDAWSAQIFAMAIRAESLQSPAEADTVTLNGWLEAPWLGESGLVLCGLIEGRLPQSLDGDPFLPDSVRPELGLNHNTQRLARDAYLLSSLLASKQPEEVHLSFSKYNSDGDPNRPSRLLFRTGAEQLPKRTLHLTQPTAATTARPKRRTEWRWQLPEALPAVKKISPTQFESYLACPFRFCMEKVLRYERAPESAREMDAAVFGNLIHRALENFGLEAIRAGQRMLSFTEQEIRERVQQLLQEAALEQFGPQPAPAVQVQLANAATRLNAFARVQASCFAEGWLILDVERRLSADDDNPLQVGPLKLSGMIDRIEQHAETGALRIMDYKTFSSLKKPAQTHLGPASHNWLPAAQVELTVGRRHSPKTWTNLQLPLYRKILEHWYPEATQSAPPETAYFVLPSDPNETGIYPFEELSENLNPGAYTSALDCAEAVSQAIAEGIFWPPQPFRNNWDDPLAPLFVNGTPEDSIHPDTIVQLKGGVR
ncbi:hypothetical protein DDZ13_12085 [Coraliomargarita sinensis]|uniref:PD-(D/E)XK endonuclease-like domain-containing protein n=1 Tax=Coraliomargarita sinensis TaxID=2174842 RepID=A0A317ZDV2_9BACT|nr:PD-(D/E)XK nuclease family protein [Coraliomargarita sinensis]PXA03426.1 hypothetical protein DDZ13_12085 [Coraliomargarita sinensis]